MLVVIPSQFAVVFEIENNMCLVRQRADSPHRASSACSDSSFIVPPNDERIYLGRSFKILANLCHRRQEVLPVITRAKGLQMRYGISIDERCSKREIEMILQQNVGK